MHDRELLDDALNRFRRGDGDAFFDMLHADRSLLPLLASDYCRSNEPEVRGFLVRVAWQYRDSTTIPFLAEALRDPADRVWKEAMDGLVTMGSKEALSVLGEAYDAAGQSERSNERVDWLREAIEQCEAELRRESSPSPESG